MKYKVGDKLRIRKNLTHAMLDDHPLFGLVGDMLTLRDKIATVTERDNLDCYYRIDLDAGKYYWTDEMFEGLAEETQPVNKQEEIPYINATEAREMFDVLHTADGLRMLVYDIIRRYAKKHRSVCIDVDTYPLEVRVLIRKELEFKGFSVYGDTVAIPRLHIAW